MFRWLYQVARVDADIWMSYPLSLSSGGWKRHHSADLCCISTLRQDKSYPAYTYVSPLSLEGIYMTCLAQAVYYVVRS